MIDTKGIGKRIQKLRRAKGLTQEQMAEAVGISINYLSNIETGRDICSTVVLLNIVNLLEASMDYIFGDSLKYNCLNHSSSPSHIDLIHKINIMTEEDCKHLLKYIQLMESHS